MCTAFVLVVEENDQHPPHPLATGAEWRRVESLLNKMAELPNGSREYIALGGRLLKAVETFTLARAALSLAPLEEGRAA